MLDRYEILRAVFDGRHVHAPIVEEHGIRRTSAHVLSLGAWIVGKCLRTVGQLFFDFFRDGEFGPIATELPLPSTQTKTADI